MIFFYYFQEFTNGALFRLFVFFQVLPGALFNIFVIFKDLLMVRFFTFSGALFHLFWCAFLSFSKKVKKRTKKDIILKNYLVRSVRLVRLVRFFILLPY